MFRITAKPTPTNKTYAIFIADEHVSTVISNSSVEEVEATYQLPNVWFRFANEDQTDTDLEIANKLSHILEGLSF